MYKIYYLFLVLITCAFTSNAGERDTVVVAQDGTGDFKSIQIAVSACRAFQTFDKVIIIKSGVYKEKIVIEAFFTHLTLIGADDGSTVITWDDNPQKPGIGTFNSYTMKVLGDHTTLRNLTIENTSGEVGQAVALHMEADFCKVENCRILGAQDTLYVAGQNDRHHFSNCYIEGTTDFIFGAATVLFESCTIHSKRNSYITAASTIQGNPCGFVFKNCKLTADPEISKVYLGRPWRDFAKTVFINCEMGNHIRPEGWHNWGQENREKTTLYAEYRSFGPGADPEKRVSWSYQLSKKEVKKYTWENIFEKCSNWDEE